MILNKILKTMFPEGYSCICCGNEIFDKENGVCESCEKLLPYITGKICLHCGEPLISDGKYCKRCKGKKFIYDRAITVFEFNGSARNLVLGLKYNNQKYLAKPLGKFLESVFVKSNLYADIIIPVPLCEKRFKTRKYNQAELISNEFAKNVGIEIRNDILFRVKETPTQTKLNFNERQQNLKDAFKVKNRKLIKDKTIILIDDVLTTGATVTECAKVLKSAGAKCVYVFAVCHTIKK